MEEDALLSKALTALAIITLAIVLSVAMLGAIKSKQFGDMVYKTSFTACIEQGISNNCSGYAETVRESFSGEIQACYNDTGSPIYECMVNLKLIKGVE